jgi:heptosyltransferase-2
MNSRLVVVELWGLGDLAIGTPFLQAASRKYDVTLIAKPYARELASRFFPAVKVKPFHAPWAAFTHKYQLWRWPWRELLNLRGSKAFDLGVSARWDPRDHFLLLWLGTSKRLGFPRLGSQVFLTTALPKPPTLAHRYEYWRELARAVDCELPLREQMQHTTDKRKNRIIVHTGAAQRLRVWPLERYHALIGELREAGYSVQVLCDPDQEKWWQSSGESDAICPGDVTRLCALLEGAGVFIGNDSGPGHLAALLGVPTFTLFGPQLPQWFTPLHPAAEWLDGRPCPYKPCFDSCHFSSPHCLVGLDLKLVSASVRSFLTKHIRTA